MAGHAFSNTRWSLVQRLHHNDPPQARKALNELCQIYWRPLYAFVRRSGHDHHEAEDLTQGFFAQLIENEGLKRADVEKSRLRNYLLAGLKHFMINDYHRARREKRGGGKEIVSIDLVEADQQYQQHHEKDVQHASSPDMVFEREWALTLLEHVFQALAQEMTDRGQEKLFTLTRGALTGEGTELSYQAIGQELDLSESAIKVAVHRLRRRYRQLLRRHVADTLSESSDPDAEIDHIIAALRAS